MYRTNQLHIELSKLKIYSTEFSKIEFFLHNLSKSKSEICHMQYSYNEKQHIFCMNNN